MNNNMREYREEVRRRLSQPFDLEGFFNHFYSEKDEEERPYGASVMITSNQIIAIPNVNNYAGPHRWTLNMIAAEIYGLPDEIINADESCRLADQNICMHLGNEKGTKQIQVFFPSEITKGHLDLLRAYEKTYGKIIKKISIKYENEGEYNSPIVLCEDANDKDDVWSHSFNGAINYAENLPKVEKIDTPDEIIMGQVLSSDGQTLQHCGSSSVLQALVEDFLNRGGVLATGFGKDNSKGRDGNEGQSL